MKTCITCNKELSLDSFYQTKSGKYLNISSYCKECHKNRRKSLYHEKTKEIEKQRSIEYRKNNLEEVRMMVRVSKRRHKALKAGIKHEDYTEQDIIDTYGTNCYLCNLPVDYTAPKQGNGSDYSSWPDHVIPTSRGGENTIENIRTCHKKCNYDKRNMTYDEYVLSGNSQENVTQS